MSQTNVPPERQIPYGSTKPVGERVTTHYGLRSGQQTASEVETGRAEFGQVHAKCGMSYYWRGHRVPFQLWESLQKVDPSLRQPLFDAHFAAEDEGEHSS